MSPSVLELLAQQWDHMASRALEMQEISLEQIRQMLCYTYEALTAYHKDALVPKEILLMLQNMDEFLQYASPEGDDEGIMTFEQFQVIYCVAETLKKGFFRGEYPCTFPVLEFSDLLGNCLELDLENGSLEELL